MSKSKVTAEQLEASAWAAALATPAIEDTVPPGWLTSRQLAAKLGKGESTISRLLLLAVKEGRAIKQDFRLSTGAGVRPVPHYCLK
jgi:hypothetical protein